MTWSRRLGRLPLGLFACSALSLAGGAQESASAPRPVDGIVSTDALWRGAVETSGELVWRTFGTEGDPRPRRLEVDGTRRYLLCEIPRGRIERVFASDPTARLWLQVEGALQELVAAEGAGAIQRATGGSGSEGPTRLLSDRPHLRGLLRARVGAPAVRQPRSTVPDEIAPLPRTLQRVTGDSRAASLPTVGWIRALRGPGVVRELRFRAPDASKGPGAGFEGRTLRIEVDGTVVVDAPLEDCFSLPGGGGRAASRYLGRDEDGTCWSRLPIAFTESVEISVLEAAGTNPVPVDGEVAWTSEAVSAAEDRTLLAVSGRFDVRAAAGATVRSVFPVEALEAGGRLIGFGSRVEASSAVRWTGTVRVSEAVVPAGIWFGETRGGGLPTGPAAGTVSATIGPMDRFCGVSWFGAGGWAPGQDAPSLRWELRPWRAATLTVATTAWCYVPLRSLSQGRRPAWTQGPGDVPGTSSPSESAGDSREALWVEGESLRPIGAVPGQLRPQDMRPYRRGGRWSGQQHQFWTGAKPGQRLTLAVPVAVPGAYRLQLALTTARDYGQFRIRFADQQMGETIELYTPEVRSTGLRELGQVEIREPGDVPLQIEVVGKHPKAVPAYLFGLDAVRLVPVR